MSGPTPSATPTDGSSRRLLVAVLLGGLLLGALLTAGIAWRRGAFAPQAELFADIDNAAGLAAGTAVRLSGVRVGEVSQLQLLPDLAVRLTLRVDADLLPRLRSDASAVLVREQLRPPVIDLDPGGAPGRLDPRQPRIAFRGKATLTEIADDLRQRLVPILDDLKQVSSMLRQRQGDVAAVLGHAASASAELAKSAAEVHALTGLARQQLGGIGGQTQALLGQGQTLLGQGQTLLGQGQASVAKVGTLIDQVNNSLNLVNGALPGLLLKADGTLDSLNAVAQSSRLIADTAAQTLPGLLRSAPPLVSDAQDLVQGLKQSWPLRSLLPPAPATEPMIESHDAQALRQPPPARP